MSLRFLIVLGLALGALSPTRAATSVDTPYTERGQIDFDTALQILNPYGTWSRIDGQWAYTPLDHQAPYTNGRWIYTEYGWYWKGRLPHSCFTEHYGYWKRGADKVWSWYPGPVWLPEIVEIRATSTYIGWRSGEVDSDGNFVETPIDRFSKMDEWTLVTLAQFAGPITPALAAAPDVVRTQLEDSADSHHVYLTYRPIDRPGPHPADIAPLCRDGGMLAPETAEDLLAAQNSPPSAAPDTKSPAGPMTGTNGPALIGTEVDTGVDTRKVKYWITMSLPTFWTKPPPDAKPDQIYMYRPDFYQDSDGIARRISLWFNPNERTKLADVFNSATSSLKTNKANGSTAQAAPAIPATEVGGAFRSPLDDYHRASAPNRTATASSKTPAPVPTGLAAPDGSVPAK
jgi:hypothetical protein